MTTLVFDNETAKGSLADEFVVFARAYGDLYREVAGNELEAEFSRRWNCHFVVEKDDEIPRKITITFDRDADYTYFMLKWA